MSRTIVVAATPTSNGDLHIGHMAGPYLAGDVYARYLRATGVPVTYTTCTDDSQSYVVSTARRLGTTPESLCATSTAAIEASLSAMGISMTGLPPIDEVYRHAVLEFVTALYEAGRFRTRTVRLPYATRAGTYLFDGLVTGTCPVCLAGSSGGVCEACGHPNNYDQLLDPRSTVDPDDPVSYRDAEILVLPMEDYRDRLTAYFAERAGKWRTHAAQLIGELLARPLPEIPVTIPAGWGVPAPFPETHGQMLYPWIEAMPAVMYSTWWSVGDTALPVDEHWRAEHDAEVVYFHGYDNVYHWGLMDLVFLLAHGDRYVLPAVNVCNEFYDLAGEKFSTSRNHLIWSVDLVAEVPRDLVRFHLALTAPEQARTNFSREALHDTAYRRLGTPWNALADAMSARGLAGTLPVTPAGRRRAAAMLERFHSGYALPGYSMNRVAETVLTHLARLRDLAADPTTAHGDLVLEVRTLLAGAAPILVDTAEAATAAGVDLSLSAVQPDSVPAFELPRLPEEASHEAADHRDSAVPDLLPLPLSAGAGARGRPLRDER
ncbi:class I tRNA ligase family protein [Actinophytocola sp.]|uniref:class I tRNA ligase family protein n=1 Tax=Actinophytocola sp. TaxID=1872138 RepID=UPI002D6B726A|nr:class I tRNA ligase family protein [Actinophytocola sp.]HYQ66098.1 class I tRNA ligase family protein [Actinophytocola sp.]